jgi:hypothetical protein
MGTETKTDLDRLLEMARGVPVSATEREQQRRSFAFGNTNIENQSITRETIDRAAEKLAMEKASTSSAK